MSIKGLFKKSLKLKGIHKEIAIFLPNLKVQQCHPQANLTI
jgi:hypothetical protein